LAFSVTILFIVPLFVFEDFSSPAKGFFTRTTIAFQKEEPNSQNMALLQAAVNVNPSPAKGGGGIVIANGDALLPESGPQQSSSSDLATTGFSGSKSEQISVYVVREGDSLSQIARMFGVSSKTIIWANDLGDKGKIVPGETLVILPVTGVQHIVKKGDTIASIAKKYDGDIKEIMEVNSFKEGYALAVNDKVIIPDGEMSIEPTAEKQPSYAKTIATTITTAITTTKEVLSPTPTPTPAPSTSGYFMRPISGGVKTQGIHGYNGVDLASSPGTPILAAATGEVILSKYAEGDPWFGGYGNYIIIEHDNGTQTVYAHLSGNLVKRGWNVVQGQVIGYMGSTGRSTGTHLHFEVRGATNPF